MARKRKRRARVAVSNPRRRRKRRSSKRRSRRARVVVMANPHRKRRRRSRARVSNPRKRRRSRSRRRARVMVIANPRRRRRSSRRRGRRNPHRSYGLKALVRARRTIKRTKRRGSSLARIYMRRHRIKANPSGGGIKGVLKMVIPTVLAMGLGRVLAGKIGPRLPFLSSLGANADVALSVGMFAAGYIVTKKVKALGAYRNAILVGLGINAVMGAIKSFAPSIAAQIGLGDSGIYDGAMAGQYQYDTGEYVQVGDFGEYIQVAGDGSMGDTSGAIEQLAGSGSPRMLAPVGVQAAVQNVPEWSPEFSRDHLQTGIFSNP